jgi:hypothetical protein
MSFALVLLPQELGDSFIGWLRIVASVGAESLEVDEGEKFRAGRSAKSRLRGRRRDIYPFLRQFC